MPYKEITAEKISFDKIGQEVEGTLTSMDETSFDGAHMFNLTTNAGKPIKFLGTSATEAILQREIGSKIRLTYTGNLKVRNGTMKNIKIEVWEDKG